MEILPSIQQVYGQGIPHEGISATPYMPPYDADSPYRWVNDDALDGPGDFELYEALLTADTDLDVNKTPREIYRDCESPSLMEARAVGSDFTFSTDDAFPDNVSFSLVGGLNCVNSQQADGTCNDYETRYYCPGIGGAPPYWTHRYPEPWFDVDDPTYSADNETRSALTSAGITLCGGQPPLDIQARTRVGSSVYSHVGPRDVLDRFDPEGLRCYDNQQPDYSGNPNQDYCDNYSVRYTYCDYHEVPNPDFYEIVINAQVGVTDSNQGPATTGPLRVYVDDIPLKRFDAPVEVTSSLNFEQLVYRTNATGELRIITEYPVFVGNVTVNGLTRLPLERTADPEERILLRARGTSGDETIRVTVGGTEIDRFELTSSWQEYLTYTSLFGGVNVEFLNDASGRDVELDWVWFNNDYRQTETQTFNTATWNSAAGACSGGMGSVMHCGSNFGTGRGLIGFGTISDTTAGTTEISYGHLSQRPMPNVVTTLDLYEDGNGNVCANVIAHNTSDVTQNIEFRFDSSDIDMDNAFAMIGFDGNDVSGVFFGNPLLGSPQTLPPHEGSDSATFVFCAPPLP